MCYRIGRYDVNPIGSVNVQYGQYRYCPYKVNPFDSSFTHLLFLQVFLSNQTPPQSTPLVEVGKNGISASVWISALSVSLPFLARLVLEKQSLFEEMSSKAFYKVSASVCVHFQLEVINAIAQVSFFRVSPSCNAHTKIGNEPTLILYSLFIITKHYICFSIVFKIYM